jgi:hypothetical protein
MNRVSHPSVESDADVLATKTEDRSMRTRRCLADSFTLILLLTAGAVLASSPPPSPPLLPASVVAVVQPAQESNEFAQAQATLNKIGVSWEFDNNRPGRPVVGIGFIRNPATDEALAVLSAFPDLERVGLHRSNVTANGIARLKKVAKLQELHLGSDLVLTDDLLDRVNELPQLRSLSIWCKNVTNNSLARLKDLTGLHKLNLSTTPIDDGALVHLRGMKELGELNLTNVGSITQFRSITDKGLEHLQGLTKLEVLLIPNSRITGQGMAFLAKMPNLRVLDLFHTNLDDVGLGHLKGHEKLEVLRMSGTRFTDEGLVALAGLKHLRELDLGFSKLTDRGMVHLRDLRELRRLNLSSTAVTEAGMVHLAGLTRLTHLELGKNTDAGLAHLANCKQLQQLTASGEGITDAGLMHLREMKDLSSLWLYRTQITPAGVEKLKKSIPRVTVYLK